MQYTHEDSVFNVPCEECGSKDWNQVPSDYPIWECKKCGNRIFAD